MNTIQDLANAVSNGQQPVVTIRSGIEQQEDCYAEKNMRARILSVIESQHDCLIVTVDYAPFEEHNRLFESEVWNGPNAVLMTARAAGYYKPQEKLYFRHDELIDTYFKLEPAQSTQLFSEYVASGCSDPYVSWLEALVLQLRVAA